MTPSGIEPTTFRRVARTPTEYVLPLFLGSQKVLIFSPERNILPQHYIAAYGQSSWKMLDWDKVKMNTNESQNSSS